MGTMRAHAAICMHTEHPSWLLLSQVAAAQPPKFVEPTVEAAKVEEATQEVRAGPDSHAAAVLTQSPCHAHMLTCRPSHPLPGPCMPHTHCLARVCRTASGLRMPQAPIHPCAS